VTLLHGVCCRELRLKLPSDVQMGFSPSTHPRLQEIVREQLTAHPGATDEEALPYIMEAIVTHAPSGSGTDRHDR
jgi:hypothetical protein